MTEYSNEELELMRMDGKEVGVAIDGYTANVIKYQKQETYYRGNNYAIKNQPDKDDPDNKLSVSFARKAVNTVAGYLAKVGNITFSSLDKSTNDLLIEVNDINLAGIETNTELVKALVNGKAYELHYMKDNKAQFVCISAENIIPFYDNNLKPSIYKFIYFYQQSIIVNDKEETIYYASVYYPDKIEYFVKKGNESNTVYELTGEDENLYEDLPIVEYVTNKDKDNLYDHVIDLIDQHDTMMSEDIANELERFATSYLKTSFHIDDTRKDENGLTDFDKIKSMKVFGGMSKDDFIDYLNKDVNDAFISNSADRFERLIYEMLQVLNFNDPELGNVSGVSILYRMIDMENLCSAIESFFSIGLQKRYELIFGMLNKQLGGEAGETIDIKWIRNLPFDVKTLAETVEKLIGVLSEETILGMFPAYIVPDVQEELERLTKEKDVDVARITATEEPQIEVDEDDSES